MKGLLVLLLALVVAGCGDFEWFPEDGTTTPTTPPTTPTTPFSNISTVTMPDSAVDTSGTIKLTAFTITPDKTATTVTPTFNFDIGNFDTTNAVTAVVTITALDGAGNPIQSPTNETVTIAANNKKTIQKTAALFSVADYNRIRSWTITIVKQ